MVHCQIDGQVCHFETLSGGNECTHVMITFQRKQDPPQKVVKEEKGSLHTLMEHMW